MNTIGFHVSAVLRVRDGYTGAIVMPGGIRCVLDGRPCVPVTKKEGYLVLLDLLPGGHTLTLKYRGYRDEVVDFTTDSGTLELDVTMKPGPGYPFRQTVTRLTVAVARGGTPSANRQFWLAYATGPEIKLAQTKVGAGESEARLFTKYPDAVASPASYLVEDGGNSEIVLLRAIEQESGDFGSPFRFDHSRGKRLLPAQSYHTGANGLFTAVFRAPCHVAVFDAEHGILAETDLKDGDNEIAANIK